MIGLLQHCYLYNLFQTLGWLLFVSLGASTTAKLWRFFLHIYKLMNFTENPILTFEPLQVPALSIVNSDLESLPSYCRGI